MRNILHFSAQLQQKLLCVIWNIWFPSIGSLWHCVLVFLEFSFSVSICMQGAWHPRIWMHWQIGKLRDGLRKWPAMWREDRGGTVPCYSHKNSKLLCIHNSSTCSHLPEPAECGEPSINLLFCKVSALVDWQKWQSGIVRRWVMRTPVWAQGRGHHHGHGTHYHGVSQVSVIPLWLENTRIFNLSEWGKGSPTLHWSGADYERAVIFDTRVVRHAESWLGANKTECNPITGW